VGGSGAGKSTIVQLLPRLYDPHIGTITFDGQDIRSYTLDSLRGQMSMVLQEAILFTGTVAENIAYGRQNATREEIIAAAMQASAHEFIEKLPDGYETMLSERAGNLSGGQRQRIAIARAFIRNTPILILDEPTTGLDAESTELVQLALKSLMRGKATVIISHDLNLIRQADTIIAIRDGAIEQVGSHRELLRRGGLYADLYSKQFGSVVAEQGGQMRADHAVAAPAKPSVPAILAGSAAQIDDDREEDEVVTPKAFQTLIGRALPAPVSEKVFQTLMMKVVPAGAAAPAQPAAPAPAATPAQAAPGRSPREAQVLRPVPLPGAAAQSAPPPAAAPAQPAAPVAPPPVASPPAAAAPAQPAAPVVPPPVASPPAAQPVAPKVQPAAPVAPPPVAQPVASPPVAPPPAAQPVAPKVQPAAPVAPPAAQPAAAPAQPAAPVAPPAVPSAPPPAAATPEPAIFETTVVRAVPAAPAAATGRTEQYPVQPGYADGRSTMRIAEDELHDLRAGKAPQAGVRAGPSGLRGERLDLLHSPAFQSEFPGITTAFDAQAMREQIQSLLFGKARPNYVIEQCELDQATYLPGEGVALRYDLVAKDRVTLQTIKPRVIGMVCASQLSCALYMRDKLAPLVELMRGRPELTPFATPAAMIEPLNMILHVFPIDGELPALVPATDPQGMAEIFRETLPEALDNTFEIERCKVELVDYARRYRAVLRYYLDGRRPGSARAERRMVYGKLFHDNIGALAGPVTAALREHVLNDRSGFQFNVPRTLSWRPDMQLALLEAIPGEPPMSDELKARLRGTPVPASARSLEAMTESCARIAAVLHTSGIKLGRRRSLDDELAALRKGFAEIQRYSPELGERLNSWLELLSTYAEQSDALPATFCHGDFTHSQILFDGERPGLVDFDSICQAEPALDLGHFLAYLRVAALKARKLTPTAPSSTVEDLTERFLKTYAQAMGGRIDDAERLRVRVAVYQLVSLLRRALRSWQKFKGSRLEGALEIIEEEIACLPQLDY
jgi:ABC-type multidrug transport system ATPase subunit